MRRERNGLKFIIIFLVVISILIATLVGKIVSNNIKNSRENQFASEMSKLSEELGKSDTVSTEIGKSVEEAKEENSSDELEFQDPEINEENTTIQNDVKTSSTVKDKKENTITQTNSNIVKENKASTETNSKPEKKEEKKEEIKFEAPLKGEIIREFAKDSLVFSNTLQEWVTHNGIDIKADKTSVVKAAANGTVSAIKNDPRYGLTVIIEHDNGYKTVYSNLLTAEFVVKGEKVVLGQTIGTVGNSASFEVADEYHLHFEIIKDNEYVNPTTHINFK